MSSEGYARISPADAAEKMGEGYTYVDVRTPLEFGVGRPAGSINVPIGDDFLAQMTARFAKDSKIILGCRAGNRSVRAANQLVAAGFTNVLEQRAGFDGVRGAFGELVEPGWVQAGLPQDRG